jgi:competence transcription factor ComK
MKKSLFIAAICALFFTSCSQKIVGTWNIDQYEINDQKGQKAVLKNAGEITLNKNGTGEKNVSYSIFSNDYSDIEPFKWKLEETNLTITGSNPKEESDFNKTWIIITNKNKKQVWKSTDGSTTVQVLELSKK